MRIAVSNIAWPSGADAQAAALLREQGACGVEIAPTKIWPKPLEAGVREVGAYRSWWEEQGLPIVAMQALLFGQPELTIFGDPATRRHTLNYLKGILQLASELGAAALVFGSPKNRQVGQVPPEQVWEIAVPFFRELGDSASGLGTCLCIEPNPPEYGCDWITTAAAAQELVERVASPGFALHFDTGGALLTQDPLDEAMGRAGSRLRHFHASRPFLHPIEGHSEVYAASMRALTRHGYAGWISIEMSESTYQRDWTDVLASSLACLVTARNEAVPTIADLPVAANGQIGNAPTYLHAAARSVARSSSR
jgi:D-psicose/D-tagatose/L-ribulose 3-epimerase